MNWLLMGLAILLFGGPVLRRWAPPHWRYISSRKRRAMFLALRAFAEENPEAKADWAGCWVYHADKDKCFVFIQLVSCLHPPSYSGYVVWHEEEELDHLGGWQFHWGILPRHAVEQYDADALPKRGAH